MLTLLRSYTKHTIFQYSILTLVNHLPMNLKDQIWPLPKTENYVIILTESEFIQCTLAQGHFCSLNTALYHIDYSKWCLPALFLKDNDRDKQILHTDYD